MTLKEILDWLKTLDLAEHYYIHRIDNKLDHSLGLYCKNRAGEPVMAIGGADMSSYGRLTCTLFLHWDRSFSDSEAAAQALWAAVCFQTGITLPGGGTVQYIRPLVPQPVYVDTDPNGVNEFEIEVCFYYSK